jgi:hypothetical protein
MSMPEPWRRVQPHSAAGVIRNAELTGRPDECPRCHHKIVPKELGFIGCGAAATDPVDGYYQCTNRHCERAFVGEYESLPVETNPQRFVFMGSSPVSPQQPAIAESITTLSATFVDIYTQALASESANLDQLTGIGLRKALEFLVKDFAIHKYPLKSEAIRGAPLANCIRDFLDDPNLRMAASRATWLGNDETHYVRRWESKDITDLKNLIRLSMNWVENVLLTEKYGADMPEKPHS